ACVQHAPRLPGGPEGPTAAGRRDDRAYRRVAGADTAVRGSERAADRRRAPAVVPAAHRRMAGIGRSRAHLSGHGAGEAHRLRAYVRTLSRPFRVGSRDRRIRSSTGSDGPHLEEESVKRQFAVAAILALIIGAVP